MSHKTTYIGLVLFAAILWGCSEEQAVEPIPPRVEEHPVSLLVDGELTKGVVTTDPKSIHSLGIIGYSTDTPFAEATAPEPDLFDNVLAERTKEGDVLSPWSYEPAVYWPSNPEIKNTFFAYSPYQDEFPEGSIHIVTESIIPEEVSYPQIIYSVPEAMSEQIDLLYSDYSVGMSDLNYNSNSGNVKFNMKHALLWLRFMIAPVKETTNDNESYTIAEFNMTAGRIINTGRFNMGTATWSKIDNLPDSDEGYEAVDYEFDNLWEEPLTVMAGEPYPMGGTSFTDCLMIIPQNIVRSQNLTAVSIFYTHDDGSDDPSDTEYYVTMPFPDVKLDKAGYVMTFIVKISASGAWIEFLDSNPIETWLEDESETPRDVEVF